MFIFPLEMVKVKGLWFSGFFQIFDIALVVNIQEQFSSK
jgi:hypothetical protein